MRRGLRKEADLERHVLLTPQGAIPLEADAAILVIDHGLGGTGQLGVGLSKGLLCQVPSGVAHRGACERLRRRKCAGSAGQGGACLDQPTTRDPIQVRPKGCFTWKQQRAFLSAPALVGQN